MRARAHIIDVGSPGGVYSYPLHAENPADQEKATARVRSVRLPLLPPPLFLSVSTAVSSCLSLSFSPFISLSHLLSCSHTLSPLPTYVALCPAQCSSAAPAGVTPLTTRKALRATRNAGRPYRVRRRGRRRGRGRGEGVRRLTACDGNQIDALQQVPADMNVLFCSASNDRMSHSRCSLRVCAPLPAITCMRYHVQAHMQHLFAPAHVAPICRSTCAQAGVKPSACGDAGD